jgi:hypothetical protein
MTGYAADPIGTLDEAPVAVLSPTMAMTAPSGVAFDSAGRIYELNAGNGTSSNPANISVYAANPSGAINESPIAVIEGNNTGLSGLTEVRSIAVDGSGKIYVLGANNTDSLINVFAAIPAGMPGVLNEAPIATIGGSNSQLDTPAGIAVDTSGYIYVVSEHGNGGPASGYPGYTVGNGSISVFAPNPSGTLNEAPVASITGSNTGLLDPVGIGLDAQGRIYTLNTGTASVAPTITVYAASPSGALNEAPVATIAGSNTGLASDYTSQLAVGSDGTIYVPVASVNEILAFPANPMGMLDEAPTGIITGSATQLANPSAIAAR